MNVGDVLGPYRVLEKLGEGGMGEVYKARDTRLDRTVAIKVLPPEFSADPDRRARFEREAKAIAGLNHPHICVLHDVGNHDGSLFLVMEHLAGHTLAERLRKGPLPLEQALTIATEIADALAAAHKQGIVHRDLKPANVMLTRSGAKLLDFGLARLAEAPAGVGASATLSSVGTVVGTAPYMAPEQVEGRPTDARTDLFAFGAVLYEMLTGTRAFAGESRASVMAAILEHQPAPLASLRPLTPSALDRLVRQCLAKAPDDRPDTAHDVANELRWMREASGDGVLSGAQPRRRRWLQTALMAAGVLAGVIIGVGVMWLLGAPTPPPLPVRSSLDVRPAEEINAGGQSPTYLPTPGGSRTALAWTPDGRALVFVGRRSGVQQLYVRRLDAAEARPLANTDGAQVPAVSLDGQWVAFWANGAIRKVPLGGGPVMDLKSGLVAPPSGLVWDARGQLFYGTWDGPVWAISPEGVAAAVTKVGEAEVAHVLPSPLPGERALLFTVRRRIWSWGDEEVVVQALPTGERRRLLTDAADARYVPTGHLVFLRRGTLFAMPFDADRLQVLGKEVAVLGGVAQALTAGNERDTTGAGQFAVAPNGALAWVPGPVLPYADWPLVTVDRRGQVSLLAAPARSYGPEVRVSPDGRRVAVTVQTLSEAGVWVYDVARGTLALLAGGGEAHNVIWSRDGRRVLFDWLAGGRFSLAAQPADGSMPPKNLVAGHFFPSSFTPDGRQVVVVSGPPDDILSVTVENGQTHVQPLIQTIHSEAWPEFSPDGRWLAYGSDVSGRNEVYVRPYPGHGTTELVSVEGGDNPAWHPGGRELFYLSLPDPAGKRRMMAVTFTPGSPPRIGHPRPLFSFDNREVALRCFPVRCYDVAPDGQRFYATGAETPPPPPVVTHINLIQNWLEELKQKVPPAR